MVAGFKGQDRPRRVVGIDTAHDADTTRAAVIKSARETLELVGFDKALNADEVIVDDRFSGPAYGLPNEETIVAIRMAAEYEAMITDPVYEGTSMAGLIGMAERGEFEKGARVLYVHLGGAPALDAYHTAFAA